MKIVGSVRWVEETDRRLCNTYNSNYAQLKLYFGHTAEVVSSDTESNYEQS